jgi:uncharacterized membrane protein YfhO
VEILQRSKNWEYLKFKVESERDVPILVKISEYPRWRAYQDGEEIKIYRASPYLMLLYGHGTIELRYERLWYDYLGYFLSATGIIWIVISSAMRFHRGDKK